MPCRDGQAGAVAPGRASAAKVRPPQLTGSGMFSNSAGIRDLPSVVIRSLPNRSAMYPSSINRALIAAAFANRGEVCEPGRGRSSA
jgi:hypothetical protein